MIDIPHEIQSSPDKVHLQLIRLLFHTDQQKHQFVGIPPYLGQKVQGIGIKILYSYVSRITT